MKKCRIYIYILLLLAVGSTKSFAAETASQILTATLAQILSIEKIIVENIEYHRDDPLPNMNIKNKTNPNANSIMLELSPVKVEVHTNSSTPIIVNATFKELKHKDGEYDFSTSNLSVSPSSYTINNPYDHVQTGIFTPFVNVPPNAAKGRYRGSLLFTLGAL